MSELDDLDALLAANGPTIALIVGTGGVGKSTLALRWSHQHANRFPDGQLFANLRGFDETQPLDPATVLDGFLRAMGVPGDQIPRELDQRAALYRSRLAHRRMLIVLDNAYEESQVRLLLPGEASSAVLITSRHRFDELIVTNGALPVPLDPLSSDDAVAVLAEVAGQQRVNAEPDAATRLAELCDRLPLALRIAAARLLTQPHLSVRDMVAELSDEQRRLGALAVGNTRVAVRSALTSSYQQLPEDAARLFRLIGLHQGPDIDNYAAAALIDVPLATARQQLDALAAAHLLVAAGPHRYSRHDLIRLYTVELANADIEREPALTRLLDFYLHSSSTAFGQLWPQPLPYQPAVRRPPSEFPDFDSSAVALAWCEAEEANLSAAIALAHMQGYHDHCWQMVCCVNTIYVIKGHSTAIIGLVELGLASAGKRQNEHAESLLLSAYSWALTRLGRPEEALEHAERAAVLAWRGDDTYTKFAAASGFSYVLIRVGDVDRATEYQAQARAAALALEDPDLASALAASVAELVPPRDSQEHHTAPIPPQVPDLPDVMYTSTLDFRARALHRLGHLDEALSYYHQALDAATEFGDLGAQADCHQHIGDVLDERGNPEEARPHWQRAVELYAELGRPEAEQLRARL